MEIFLAVCDAGGVTSAAARLGISQAAVSQRIGQLEQDIGVQLFDRRSRPQRLLPAGILLRERGRRIVLEVEELRHTLERFRDVTLPELRIGIIESIAPALVPRLVPELRELVGVLSLTSGIIGPLLPDIQRGDLDIMITSELLADAPGLECHTLIREPFVLLLPPGIDAPTEPEGLARLARELTFIRYGSRRRMSVLIDNQMRRYGIELPRTLDFVSSAPIIDLVRQGLGWAILTPLCLYSARAPMGDVKIMPLPQMRFTRQIELAAPEDRLGELPRQVLDICLEILRSDVEPVLKSYAPFAADQISCGEFRIG